MDIVTAQVWPLFGMGMLAGAALAVAWLQRRRIGVEEAHRLAIAEVERARQRQASAKARIAVLQTRNDQLELMLRRELRIRLDLSRLLANGGQGRVARLPATHCGPGVDPASASTRKPWGPHQA